MPENLTTGEPPKIYIKSSVDDQVYILGQVYNTLEGDKFIIDRQGAIHRVAPPTEPQTKEKSRKRTNTSTEPDPLDSAPEYQMNSLSRDVHHAIVHRLGEMAKALAGSSLGEEANQLYNILDALNQRIFKPDLSEQTQCSLAPYGGVETGTQTSRTPSPVLGAPTTEIKNNTSPFSIPTMTANQKTPCPNCNHAGDDLSMDVDPPSTSKRKNQGKKTTRIVKPGLASPESNKLTTTAASTSNAEAPWSEDVGRKTRKAAKTTAPPAGGETNFPALPPTIPTPRRGAS